MRLAGFRHRLAIATTMIYWLWAAVAAAEAGHPLKTIGGSNYISYGHMEDYLDTLAFDPQLGRLRFDVTKLRPVIATYHRDPASVHQQLQAMSTNGQKIISFPLWFGDAKLGDLKDGYHLYLAMSNGGHLQEQQRKNLAEIIGALANNHFESMILRFIPQGLNSPYQWSTFEQDTFDTDWAFIHSTVELAREHLAGTGIRLMVDLGGEQAGANRGRNHEYVVELWRRFCAAYRECSDFAYLSFNPTPPNVEDRITNHYDWQMEAGGPIQDIYAFDTYGYGYGKKLPVRQWNVYAQLADIYRVLSRLGQLGKTIFIQEAFYNDPRTAQDLRQFFADHPDFRLLTVIQWPNTRERYQKFFSQGMRNWASEDFPADYCVYAQLAPNGPAICPPSATPSSAQ
jgi:hypothetical protein